MKKAIKCSTSLAFYHFSSTRLISSVKHEHSCYILYLYSYVKGRKRVYMTSKEKHINLWTATNRGYEPNFIYRNGHSFTVQTLGWGRRRRIALAPKYLVLANFIFKRNIAINIGTIQLTLTKACSESMSRTVI